MKKFCILLVLITHQVEYMKSGDDVVNVDSPTSTLEQGESVSDKPSKSLVFFDSSKPFKVKYFENQVRASSHEHNTDSPRFSRGMTPNIRKVLLASEELLPHVEGKPRKNLQPIKRFRAMDYTPVDIPPTGSMTPYEHFAKNVPSIEYPGCNVERVWTLFRHSIRYPGSETIYGMRTRLRNLQEALILKHYENNKILYDITKIKNWKLDSEIAGTSDFLLLSNEKLNEKSTKKKKGTKDKKGTEITEEKALTKQGKEEMLEMGKRFREKFGKILGETYSKNVIFKFTKSERTEESAKQFFKGLFNSEPPIDQEWHEPTTDKKDPTLKFDSICSHWRDNYKKHHLNKYMLESFTYGGVIENTLEKLTKDLGLPPKSLTLSDAKLLYEVCAFEKSWGLKDTPWCDILKPEYQEVLEYLEDLELFYNDGPMNEVNKKIGCILFKDMVEHLIGKELEEKRGDSVYYNLEAESTAKGTFYFSHLTAVLKFLTHLGLYDEQETLTYKNYEDMKDRMWKSSKIGSFATNISFVLMSCNNSLNILTLHQERPVRLPGCPKSADLCPLDTFLKIYQDSIINCQYDQLCKPKMKSYYSQVEEILAN